MADKQFWDTEEVIETIEKNKSEKIEIKLCTRKDVNYVDIRILKRALTSDDYMHTKNGICLSYDLYKQIRDIINNKIED